MNGKSSKSQKDNYFETWQIIVKVPIVLRIERGATRQSKKKVELRARNAIHLDTSGCNVDFGCYSYQTKNNLNS